MANPLDIVYSRMNADGTGFNEKTLVPVLNHFVICGPTGDLTTWTGSIGNAVSASYAISASWAPTGSWGLETGSTYPFTASWAVSASYASTASYAMNGGGGGGTDIIMVQMFI